MHDTSGNPTHLGQEHILFVADRSIAQAPFSPGFVVRRGSESTVAQFEHQLDLAPGEPVWVLYRSAGGFWRQRSHVSLLAIEGGRALYEAKPKAKAEPHESRSAERVMTVYDSLSARLGDEPECRVLNISSNGSLVTAHAPLAAESEQVLEIRVDDTNHRGAAVVRSVRSAQLGGFHYGLEFAPGPRGDELRESVCHVWGAFRAALVK